MTYLEFVSEKYWELTWREKRQEAWTLSQSFALALWQQQELLATEMRFAGCLEFCCEVVAL